MPNQPQMDSASDVRNFCVALPKVELHAHLLGSIRQASLHKRLEQNVGAVEAEKLMKRSRIHGIDLQRSMTEQMEMFDIARSAFHNPEDKKRIAVEFIEDCAKENVVYLELRTSGGDEEKFEAIFAAFEEIRHRQLPVVTRMISSVQRSWSFEQAEKSIRLAIQNRSRGVVGLDLCGDPTSGDFRRFRPLFEHAQREGLRFTCHFAESHGEGDLSAILECRPDRLGHCSFMHESEEMQRRVFESKIPIEACLASNINTMRLTQGAKAHPIMNWLQRKHPVVLCTDNVGLLGVDLSDHYAMIAPFVSREALWDLAESSVDHIFAGDDVKEQLRAIYRNARAKANVKSS